MAAAKGPGVSLDDRLPADPTAEFELRLYVAGQTPKSVQAFANLKKICEEHLAGRYRDRGDRPARAAAAGPGRSDPRAADAGRRLPEPIKKIIGDLSNTERVLVGLDVRPLKETA